jgi:hypothetical protein
MEAFLLNLVMNLVKDEAQSLTEDLVSKHIPDDMMESLDAVVTAMPENSFVSVSELLKG